MKEQDLVHQEKPLHISRRSFLGGAAIATLGVGGLASLSSCSPETPQSTSNSEGNEGASSNAAITDFNPQDTSYDSYTTDFATLFSPIQVGSRTLKNRIIKTSAGSDTQFSKDATISQNALEYHELIARGGASMILVEAGALTHLGFNPASWARSLIPLDNLDEGIEPSKALVDVVHAHDCLIGYQVSGPGNLGEPPVVNEITTEEIKQYVKDLSACCGRLKKAGFDCVEIKGATTDGLNAFFSRRMNKREDEYGPQSLENRTRFFVELLQGIREACGEDMIIATLINAMEVADENLGADNLFLTNGESKEIAKILEANGADFIQFRIGAPGKEGNNWIPDLNHAGNDLNGMTGFGTYFDFSRHFSGLVEGRYSGAAAFVPLVKEIKSIVDIPVGCAAYMDPRTSPDLIERHLADGDIDLVFMNRPLVVDPELPNKLMEGRRDEVAPCCRCLHCHNKTPDVDVIQSPECCRVNATTQYAYTEEMPEGYEPLPAEISKKVMVIGGGPSGMEAARIAAQRGHVVSLYEKSASVGGLVKISMAYKTDHERLQDLVDYLSHQQEIKGVSINLSTEVTRETVDSESPDVVVVATGGIRDSRLSSDSESPVVGIIGDYGSFEIGDKVVICGVGAQAIDLCMFLLSQGKTVTMVHEGTVDMIDKEQSPWYRSYILPAIYAKGVKIWNGASVDAVGDGVLNITSDAGIATSLECDTVIECWDMLPDTQLVDALKSNYEVHSVGDCAEPYNIQRAIHTGNITARNI